MSVTLTKLGSLRGCILVASCLALMSIVSARFFYSHDEVPVSIRDAGRLPCGASALLAMGAYEVPAVRERIQAAIANSRVASDPTCSLADLVELGRRAGLDLVGLSIQPDEVQHLPLPAIVHLKGGHFVTLVEVHRDHVVLLEGVVARQVRERYEFDQLFSGNCLCGRRQLAAVLTDNGGG